MNTCIIESKVLSFEYTSFLKYLILKDTNRIPRTHLDSTNFPTFFDYHFIFILLQSELLSITRRDEQYFKGSVIVYRL